MEFEQLGPDYLRELVEWSPEFAFSCHLLSKTISSITKHIKIELFKDTPIQKSEIFKHIVLNLNPFGCVYYEHCIRGFTCGLGRQTTETLSPTHTGESLDISCYMGIGTYSNYFTLGTVKTPIKCGKICFDTAGKYLQIKNSISKKSRQEETLTKFFGISNQNTGIPGRGIKMEYLVDLPIYLDCLTVFQILSRRTCFPPELWREQTLKYFETAIEKLTTPQNIFLYCYISYLRLGLDSIHNPIFFSGYFNLAQHNEKLVEMMEAIRKRIGELV